jgi:hypothetical protein
MQVGPKQHLPSSAPLGRRCWIRFRPDKQKLSQSCPLAAKAHSLNCTHTHQVSTHQVSFASRTAHVLHWRVISLVRRKRAPHIESSTSLKVRPTALFKTRSTTCLTRTRSACRKFDQSQTPTSASGVTLFVLDCYRIGLGTTRAQEKRPLQRASSFMKLSKQSSRGGASSAKSQPLVSIIALCAQSRSRYNAAAVKSAPLSSRAPARRLCGAPGVRLASSSLPSISQGTICGAWPSMERCCPVVPMNTQRDPLGPGAGGPAVCQAPCARAADLFAGTDLGQTTSVAESSARLCISGQAGTPPAGAT